jgi:hypothetical protein
VHLSGRNMHINSCLYLLGMHAPQMGHAAAGLGKVCKIVKSLCEEMQVKRHAIVSSWRTNQNKTPLCDAECLSQTIPLLTVYQLYEFFRSCCLQTTRNSLLRQMQCNSRRPSLPVC